MKATPALHAGLVALRLGGLWRGALISGPSAVGKSDLTLRALAEGFRLAADDRTIVFASGGRLFGRAPRPLAGLIEVRGIGVVAADFLPFAEIILAVHCVADPGEAERMAPVVHEAIGAVLVPVLRLWPLEASAPAKLRRALRHLGSPGQPAYQAPLQRGPRLRAGRPGVGGTPLGQP
jgi:serine kinase of HPr protein (carbohydrate metabolism regulator)